MNKELKVGVVGVGRMGRFHLEKYLATPGCEVIGFYDVSTERALAVEKKFGVREYENLLDLLFDLDAVTIATPTNTHFSITKQALQAGTHVLVEKPMCCEQSEARVLVDLAREKDRILQVGFVERFRLMKLSQGIERGPVRYIDAERLALRPGREDSIGVISDLMVHDLDLVLSFIPEKVSRISALGTSVVTSKCDVANVRLEFENGAVANLSASRVSSFQRRYMQVYGLSGVVAYDLLDSITHTYNKENEWTHSLVSQGDLDALKIQISHFVESCLGRVLPMATGEEGLRTLCVTEAIEKEIDKNFSVSDDLLARKGEGLEKPLLDA